MAEIKNQQEPTFPSKRKTDDPNPQDPPNKAPKLATLDNNDDDQEPNPNAKHHTDSSEPGHDVVVQGEAGNGGNELRNEVVADKEEAEEEEDDDDDDDDGDEEEESNSEAEVDRKGKGVLRDDKGKQKLIAEEEDDDDDDDSDDDDDDSDEDGNVSGADSDFSDDPLAEVDLNNILPSRTRRRTVQPGLHIAGDAGIVPSTGDDDDDDSDA